MINHEVTKWPRNSNPRYMGETWKHMFTQKYECIYSSKISHRSQKGGNCSNVLLLMNKLWCFHATECRSAVSWNAGWYQCDTVWLIARLCWMKDWEAKVHIIYDSGGMLRSMATEEVLGCLGPGREEDGETGWRVGTRVRGTVFLSRWWDCSKVNPWDGHMALWAHEKRTSYRVGKLNFSWDMAMFKDG